MLPGSDIQHEASFDLTPMIDVILLLIVFFMLSAQFSRSEQLPLELPAESGERTAGEERPSEIIIDLDKSGGLFVRGQPATLPELAGLIGVSAAASDASRMPSVIVRADRRCKAEHLNTLASELVRLGLKSWRLGTTPVGAPGVAAPDAGSGPQ